VRRVGTDKRYLCECICGSLGPRDFSSHSTVYSQYCLRDLVIDIYVFLREFNALYSTTVPGHELSFDSDLQTLPLQAHDGSHFPPDFLLEPLAMTFTSHPLPILGRLLVVC